MAFKRMITKCKDKDNDFIFLKMDTLIERLRRMRALNSSPSHIGLTECTWRRSLIDLDK